MADEPMRALDLRVEAPVLEPDEAFLGRLTVLAASTAAPARARSTSVRRPRYRWAAALAGGGAATLLVGGAWAGGFTPLGLPGHAHHVTPAHPHSPPAGDRNRPAPSAVPAPEDPSSGRGTGAATAPAAPAGVMPSRAGAAADAPTRAHGPAGHPSPAGARHGRSTPGRAEGDAHRHTGNHTGNQAANQAANHPGGPALGGPTARPRSHR